MDKLRRPVFPTQIMINQGLMEKASAVLPAVRRLFDFLQFYLNSVLEFNA
jgi:hypothetical protein